MLQVAQLGVFLNRMRVIRNRVMDLNLLFNYSLLWVVLCLIYVSGIGIEEANAQSDTSELSSPQTIREWHDGTRWRKLSMSHEEIAVILETPDTATSSSISLQNAASAISQESIQQAEIEKISGNVTFYRLTEKEEPEGLIARAKSITARADVFNSSPVFYPATSSNKVRMILTGEIIVGYVEIPTNNDILALSKKFDITFVSTFRSSPKSVLFDARSAQIDSMGLANAIREELNVSHSYPNWLREISLDPPATNSSAESENTTENKLTTSILNEEQTLNQSTQNLDSEPRETETNQQSVPSDQNPNKSTNFSVAVESEPSSFSSQHASEKSQNNAIESQETILSFIDSEIEQISESGTVEEFNSPASPTTESSDELGEIHE